MSDSLQLHGLYSARNSPSQNTGVGSLSLLHGIFPTQGLKPSLPHCRQTLYRLSYQGSQRCRRRWCNSWVGKILWRRDRLPTPVFLGFPGGSDGKNKTKQSACYAGDPGSIPVSRRSPGEGKWQLTLVFLPGESHGQRSLVGYSPWGRKESHTTEQLHFVICLIITLSSLVG